MNDFLQYTLDKFTFKVATGRYYNPAGVWAKADGKQVTVGVSDFFQQRNGDVAFAEVLEVGTSVSATDNFATIETIKVDVELPCPVGGTITAVNDKLEMEAELINQDPYGAGWLATITTADWSSDRANLMSPAVYFEHIKALAKEETD